MSSKRIYRRTPVNQIDSETIARMLERKMVVKGKNDQAAPKVCVGLDIAKNEVVVVLRWDDETFEKPWSVKNPTEIPKLIELLLQLKDQTASLIVGLESTGTYGEAVRLAMTNAFIEVHRVSGKSVSDYKEIFDGVPSQHDGKDAAMIAELAAFGKGTPWPFELASQEQQRMKRLTARWETFRIQANQWMGKLEGALARHWPELTESLPLNRATLHQICLHYGDPTALAKDPGARKRLRSWGRGRLGYEKIDAIIESAKNTVGVPVSGEEKLWLQEITEQVRSALEEVKACEKALNRLAREHDSMKRYVSAVGPVTLSTIWVTVGDPRKYHSSGAFLKALGLNLKELSSGKHQGQLKITKRGPGITRRLLYYWALRAIQDPALKQWYADFQKVGKSKTRNNEHRKMKGIVAVMRKLCRSLWHVYQHDEPFDYSKVFPGRPLQKRKRRARRKQVSRI